jgi:chromate reductase, NAD(P)H dehydrogenase (quinone)
MADEIKVLGVCGSLRKASLSMAALRTCKDLMPAGMSLTIATIGDIPMYNQDVFDAGIPAPAKRFYDEIAAADGVLIATPEYNFSLPAVLKNAIDWVSKMPNQPFSNKPIAVFSASQGPLGGARVQYDVRKILVQLWGLVLPRPEVFIGAAQTKFDKDGRLTDEATKKFLADLVTGFKTWIERMRAARPR